MATKVPIKVKICAKAFYYQIREWSILLEPNQILFIMKIRINYEIPYTYSV